MEKLPLSYIGDPKYTTCIFTSDIVLLSQFTHSSAAALALHLIRAATLLLNIIFSPYLPLKYNYKIIII